MPGSENRPQEVPDVASLALAIARSGAVGASREGLSAALGVPGETVESLLRAMVVAGQVEMVRVDGQIVYRTAG